MRLIKNQYLLGILPLVYILLGFACLENIKYFFLSGYDPSYAYLINGTNLASGNMEIGHTDHPGTTVQCFIAIVIFMKYLFSGTSYPLYQDVLNQPEMYIKTGSVILILLLGAITFLSGIILYKKYKNIFISLLVQLIPITSYNGIFHSIYPTPESFVVIISTLFIAIILKFLLSPSPMISREKNLFFIFCGVFCGFLIVTKITCIPILIIILLLAENKADKARLLLTMFLSAVVFLLPSLNKIHIIFKWFFNLFTHSGIYGQGKEQIIQWSEFADNIHKIFTTQYFFTWGYIIIVLSTLILLLARNKKETANNTWFRLLTGVCIALTIQILMVAKHYSFHYLLPAQGFIFPGLIASAICFQTRYKSLYHLNRNFLKYSFLLLMSVFLIHKAASNSLLYPNHYNPLFLTKSFITANYKNTPVIIASEGLASPFVESALYFGSSFAGETKHTYLKFLKEKYRHTYFYYHSQNRQFMWELNLMVPEIMSTSHEFLLYFRHADENYITTTIDHFTKIDSGDPIWENKKIYKNEMTSEVLYLLHGDPLKFKAILSRFSEFFCDLENLSPDRTVFLSTNEKIFFRKADRISEDKSFSGKYSVKLTAEHQYGLDTEFDVKPGDFIDITVWRNSSDGKGGIIAQAKNASQFYIGGDVITKNGKGGWEEVSLKAKIPLNYPENKVCLYLFYAGKETAYFDDLRIKIYHNSSPN